MNLPLSTNRDSLISYNPEDDTEEEKDYEESEEENRATEIIQRVECTSPQKSFGKRTFTYKKKTKKIRRRIYLVAPFFIKTVIHSRIGFLNFVYKLDFAMIIWNLISSLIGWMLSFNVDIAFIGIMIFIFNFFMGAIYFLAMIYMRNTHMGIEVKLRMVFMRPFLMLFTIALNLIAILVTTYDLEDEYVKWRYLGKWMAYTFWVMNMVSLIVVTSLMSSLVSNIEIAKVVYKRLVRN